MPQSMELLQKIERVARDDPDRVAYFYADGLRVSYADLISDVVRRREALGRDDGTGQTIVLQGRSGSAHAAAFLAILSSGANALLLDPRVPRAQVDFLLERVQAAGDIGGGQMLLPTSGSTGAPKIVCRSAASIDVVAANMVEAIGMTSHDRILAAVPFAHSYGIEHGVLAPLWAGATVHAFEGLDLAGIATLTQPPTVLPAVPSMIERLADASDRLDVLRSLRTIYSAGAPLPDIVRERFASCFGQPIGQLYGATEIGTVTYRAGHDRAGSDVGWPLRGVSIRILSDGDVAIRSPSMFDGYLDEHVELIDGHFLTGDLGTMTDDGALQLVGRSKLLIDVGGLKVNPLEVEAALAEHSAVAECVVVPIRQSETVFAPPRNYCAARCTTTTDRR